MPELELAVSATTRASRGRGRSTACTTTSSTTRSSIAASIEGDFLEHAEYSGRRYGTLRSELEKRTADGASVVLEIEVQGARQVAQTMPEAVRIFIAPPSEETLRTRLIGRGHRRHSSRSSAACRSPRPSSPRPDEFPHVVHNDRLDDAADQLEQIVRAANA